MRRVNDVTYDVRPGERITIQVTPTNFGGCCSLGMAQQEQNCDQLRSSVEQLEKIDIKAMSPSLGQLYRESLLKVYSEFSKCLARDISTTAAMQEAVASTSASPAVDAKLRQ